MQFFPLLTVHSSDGQQGSRSSQVSPSLVARAWPSRRALLYVGMAALCHKRCRAQKYSPSCRMLINVMQPAEYRLCDNLAVGPASSDLEDCRITGCALTKRSMRTPTVEICDIRRNGSTQMALAEDEQVVEILGSH